MITRNRKSRELQIAVTAAKAAGALIKRRVGRAHRIRFKEAINIVTDVDEQAEALIVKLLRRHFPRDGILTEEQPELAGSERKWVIDPLDGTTNFSRSFPFFCVSIGLEEAGRPVAGVVYDPVHEEMFTALKGEGAFCNNKRIRVSSLRTMRRAFLATGFSYSFKKKRDNNMKHFRNMMMASLSVRRAGAAALDLCYVASGRFDGFWEMDLQPWDTAAASLIIGEAGGKISQFDGSAFSIYDKNILASNGKLHRQMIKTLTEK